MAQLCSCTATLPPATRISGGQIDFNYQEVNQISLTIVPEPGPLIALIGRGAVGLAVARRRRLTER